ncbi:MAG: phosphodiester glycosidase family protein [Anaerolineaceae bacterium]|jgi:exopolysaccharide biosynthesis protein
MFKSKKKIIITSIILIIGMIAYLAADRYLIRHVEIADVSAYASTANISLPMPEEVTPTATSTVQEDNTEINAALSMEAVTSDDWHYQSSTFSIEIEKVTTGTGADTLTYFVADVVISDATQLLSAFADNQFGQNIIAYTSRIAEENDALFAINGDYYGFRKDGIIIRNGVIYRDEPARIGLAFYRDGSMQIYDETQTNAGALLADGVWNTLSFGPALLDDYELVGNLDKVEVDTNLGNHPIQGNQPRTGIGIIDNNHFVFIVVDGRSTGYSRGASLTEFAEMFQQIGCREAYNLDGGGSSTMYFMGRVVNNPLGKNKERGTSDILFIGE